MKDDNTKASILATINSLSLTLNKISVSGEEDLDRLSACIKCLNQLSKVVEPLLICQAEEEKDSCAHDDVKS